MGMASQIRWKQSTKRSHSTADSIMHAKQTLMKIYLKYFSTHSTGPLLTLYRCVLIFVLIVYPCTAKDAKPGCFLVGFTREVEIFGCVTFNLTVNACHGYCESYAQPSPKLTLAVNRRHEITSHAECCSIRAAEDKSVLVDCFDGERLVVFKSARSCSCSVCRS